MSTPSLTPDRAADATFYGEDQTDRSDHEEKPADQVECPNRLHGSFMR